MDNLSWNANFIVELNYYLVTLLLTRNPMKINWTACSDIIKPRLNVQ